MTTLKKEPEESKFGDHPTISLSAHTAETEETILRTRFYEEIEEDFTCSISVPYRILLYLCNRPTNEHQ